MGISLDFHFLGVRLGGLEIKVDEGTDKVVPAGVDESVNRVIKWFSRKWTTRMTR